MVEINNYFFRDFKFFTAIVSFIILIIHLSFDFKFTEVASLVINLLDVIIISVC